MQTIATNIRFSLPEYREIKRLAAAQRQSIAELVRQALREHKKNSSRSIRGGKKLFKKFIDAAVKIDVSTTALVQEARRFK